MISGFANIKSTRGGRFTRGDQSSRFAGGQWQVSFLGLQNTKVLDRLSSENLIPHHSTISKDYTKDAGL